MVLGMALLAEIALVFPEVALGKIQTRVVLPSFALIATDHRTAIIVTLVSADAADDGISVFLAFFVLLFGGLHRLRTCGLGLLRGLALLLRLCLGLCFRCGVVQSVGKLGVVALVRAARAAYLFYSRHVSFGVGVVGTQRDAMRAVVRRELQRNREFCLPAMLDVCKNGLNRRDHGQFMQSSEFTVTIKSHKSALQALRDFCTVPR
jgi:hypothetical protein